MINIQSNFGNFPQPEVLHSTEPLLSILIDRITGIPYEGYFKAYDVPELPTDADDFWRIKYGHIGGDDYLITAVRVWGDEIYTRRMNVYAKTWKTDAWSKVVNQADLVSMTMMHDMTRLPNCTTVLEMAMSVTTDTSTFAWADIPLAKAPDNPLLGEIAEFQYLVLMDYGPRRTVVAIQYIGFASGSIRTWKRQIYDGKWSQDKWTLDATAELPAEHPLTISDGLVGNSDMSNTYRKGNDGRVTVGLGVTAADSASSSSETYIADGFSVFILPAGFRTYRHEVRHVDLSNSGGSPNGYGHLHLYPSGLAEVRGVTVPDVRSMFCEFGFWTKQEQATLQSQVRLAAEDPAPLTLTEPIEKCMCVVDEDNRYVEFVLVMIDQDDTGVIQTVHNYTMADGERLVNASVPPIKYLRDNKLPRPSWDEATSTWLE